VNHMNDDEISRMFAEATPEDFSAPRHTFLVQTSEPGDDLGSRELFRVKVAGLLDEVREIQADAPDGKFNPHTVLESPAGRRIYGPGDDEDNETYYARVAKDAASWGATFFFTAQLAPAAVYEHDAPARDIPADDLKRIEAAQAEGMLEEHIVWYAETADDRFAGTDQGVIVVEETGTGVNVPSDVEDSADFMRAVLAFRRA
jgi:hypothetical protein